MTDPRDPKWTPYGNTFTLTGRHGKISSQMHNRTLMEDPLWRRTAVGVCVLAVIYVAVALALVIGGR